MARILGNPFGELRGKSGGSVFSRNKGGQIMRVYAKPTNTNSQAQRNQRNNFRAMSGSWNTLTAGQRQMWEQFAKNGFNPLLRTNTGNQSGVNAFKANKNTIAGFGTRFVTTVWATSAEAGPIAHTITPVAFDPIAPVFTVRPNIKDVAGAPCSFDFNTTVVQASGPVSIKMNLNGVGASGLTQGDLLDENDIPFGFALYMSDSVKSIGSKPKSPVNFCIGNTGLVTFSATDLTDAAWIQIRWDAINLIPNYVGYPQVGSSCLLTLVVVGSNGTQSIACQGYVTITA
jgi:hypothetical protein